MMLKPIRVPNTNRDGVITSFVAPMVPSERKCVARGTQMTPSSVTFDPLPEFLFNVTSFLWISLPLIPHLFLFFGQSRILDILSVLWLRAELTSSFSDSICSIVASLLVNSFSGIFEITGGYSTFFKPRTMNLGCLYFIYLKLNTTVVGQISRTGDFSLS